MYKVYFSYDSDVCSSEFAELKTDVEAVQLALALHQSSNVPHRVCVKDVKGCEFLTLVLSK